MSERIFRRTLRLPRPMAADSVDALLIEHIEELEKDSPHKLQEWIRQCLRNAFVQERAVVDQERRGREGKN